jgi:hypothetical protein
MSSARTPPEVPEPRETDPDHALDEGEDEDEEDEEEHEGEHEGEDQDEDRASDVAVVGDRADDVPRIPPAVGGLVRAARRCVA